MCPLPRRATIGTAEPLREGGSVTSTRSGTAKVQGQSARDAEILEVLGSGGPPYRVRWDDGRISIIFPGPDVFIEHFPRPHPRG